MEKQITKNRPDYIFSYWVLLWFLLYIAKIIHYNPKPLFVFGIFFSVFQIVIMFLYNKEFNYIFAFILANILMKILLPGITGWAQVNGRDELSIPDKVGLDVEYLNRQSFWFDIKILWMTFLKVMKRDGVSH